MILRPISLYQVLKNIVLRKVLIVRNKNKKVQIDICSCIYTFLGFWACSYYLGLFLGPSIAGFLVESYGFEWTTVVFSILYCISITMNLFELAYTCNVQKE